MTRYSTADLASLRAARASVEEARTIPAIFLAGALFGVNSSPEANHAFCESGHGDCTGSDNATILRWFDRAIALVESSLAAEGVTPT